MIAVDPRVVPGARVRHPTEAGWGVGHVQSVIGDRITVNFEEHGKVVINGGVISLEVVDTKR
jgi:transcription elongation factor GreA-like protein